MTNATNHTRRLAPRTLVISVADGEPGQIIEVCTFRRNGLDAYSYVVETATGHEIWQADEVVLPAAEKVRTRPGAAKKNVFFFFFLLDADD